MYTIACVRGSPALADLPAGDDDGKSMYTIACVRGSPALADPPAGDDEGKSMCTIACVRGSPALADPPAGDDGEAVFMEHMHLGMLMCRGTRVEGGDGEERADRMRAVVHRAAVSCAHLTTLLLELANAPLGSALGLRCHRVCMSQAPPVSCRSKGSCPGGFRQRPRDEAEARCT